MAHTVTRTTIMQMIVIIQKRKESHLFASHTEILSNGPLSVETNTVLDCGSDIILLRKDIAKI